MRRRSKSIVIAIHLLGSGLAICDEFDDEFGKNPAREAAIEPEGEQAIPAKNFTIQSEIFGSHALGKSQQGSVLGGDASGLVKWEKISLHIGGYGFFDDPRFRSSTPRGRFNHFGVSSHLSDKTRLFHGRDTLDLGQFHELPLMGLVEPQDIHPAPANNYQRGRVLTSLSHTSFNHVFEGYIFHEGASRHLKGESWESGAHETGRPCQDGPYGNSEQFLVRYRNVGAVPLDLIAGHFCNPGFSYVDAQIAMRPVESPTAAVGGSASTDLGQLVVKMEVTHFGAFQRERNALQLVGLGVDYGTLSGNTASIEAVNYHATRGEKNGVTQVAFFGQYLPFAGILSLKPKIGLLASGGQLEQYVQFVALQRLGTGVQVGFGADRIQKHSKISGWNIPTQNATYIEVRKQF
jgi:hypothetical protein